MSQNNHGKELVGDQYNSLPIKKALNWVPNKWRRLSLKHCASSSSVPEVNLQDAPEEVAEPTADVESNNPEDIRHFIFREEESYKWSKDVVGFVNNGDAPFCYSRFMPLKKLDTIFWKSLLGYCSDNRLLPLHIEGWVQRMMHVRYAKIKKNGPDGLEWTICPPQFRSELFDDKAAKYATGTHELYPPFWEVQYVYIPFYVNKVDEWLLARINLYTMEMTQYWSNHNYSKNSSKLIHLSILDPFDIFFQWLLEEINYWERYKGPHIHPEKRKLNVHVVNDDYLPRDGHDLGEDSGVLVCMLMHKLVQQKAVNMEGDFKDECIIFRRFMADQLYKARYSVR